jgi:adenylate cyclase
VAPEAYAHLVEQFDLEERGPIDVRGKGRMRTWFLIGRKAGFSRSSLPGAR